MESNIAAKPKLVYIYKRAFEIISVSEFILYVYVFNIFVTTKRKTMILQLL